MSNPFITEKCTLADAKALVEVGVPLMKGDEKVHWAEIEKAAGTEVGYSRGWLIVRWAYLAEVRPEWLIPTADLIEAARKAASANGNEGTFNANRDVLAAEVLKLRNAKISWGEIAVRLGVPESRVRTAYLFNSGMKDLGQRIGKGGRFAYDDGALYTDNRKAEGAWIKPDLRRKPTVEELLNFKPKAGTPTAKGRAQLIGKAVAIQALLEDAATPAAQKANIKVKLADFMAKHGITFQDMAKAKASKAGRKAA